MAFDLKQALNNQNKQSVVTNILGVAPTKMMAIPYSQLELGTYKIYDIDEQEVKDLAESIASVGLEQNLVVKESGVPNHYTVVTGHKRMSAIRYIFEKGIDINAKVRQNIESPMCIVIPADEDELITRFRMHETNVHQRRGFTVAEIEDYINTVNEAKERKLEINGKQVKGTTRAILKAQFNISDATAKKYIKVIKEGNAELKKALDDGEMSINNAYDILMGNAEPIINPKDEESQEEKIKAITKNQPKEKKEISTKTIRQTNKKMLRSIDKMIEEIETYDRLSEEELQKIYDVQRLLLEFENLMEKKQKAE